MVCRVDSRQVGADSDAVDVGVRAVFAESDAGRDADALAVGASVPDVGVAVDVRVGGGVDVVVAVVMIAVVVVAVVAVSVGVGVDVGVVVVGDGVDVVVLLVSMVVVVSVVVAVAVVVDVVVVVAVVVFCPRSHPGYRGLSCRRTETPVATVRAVSGSPRLMPVPRTVCVPGKSTSRCSTPSGKCRVTVAVEFVSTVA